MTPPIATFHASASPNKIMLSATRARKRLLADSLTLLALLCCVVTNGCGKAPSLRLATTTSTYDSGLLDVLLPQFEKTANIEVNVFATGTGKALKLAENGDVDVVFVHARTAEDAFMAAKHGVRREDVMYNMFAILGPADDPAKIKGLAPDKAFEMIAEAKSRFVSRGDESGTHKRETQIWKAVGKSPEWNKCFETGEGMGKSLTIADQKQAYILADYGTYLKWKSKIELIPLVTEGENLQNQYGVMCVNPAKSPKIQGKFANQFVDYLISPAAQNMIKNYKVDDHPLFIPLRLDDSENANSN